MKLALSFLHVVLNIKLEAFVIKKLKKQSKRDQLKWWVIKWSGPIGKREEREGKERKEKKGIKKEGRIEE